VVGDTGGKIIARIFSIVPEIIGLISPCPHGEGVELRGFTTRFCKGLIDFISNFLHNRNII
jgi:hypothetical protein